jgi:hypothetical protein
MFQISGQTAEKGGAINFCIARASLRSGDADMALSAVVSRIRTPLR